MNSIKPLFEGGILCTMCLSLFKGTGGARHLLINVNKIASLCERKEKKKKEKENEYITASLVSQNSTNALSLCITYMSVDACAIGIM